MSWKFEDVVTLLSVIFGSLGAGLAAVLKTRNVKRRNTNRPPPPTETERENTGQILNNWTKCEEKLRDALQKIDAQKVKIDRNESYIDELRSENHDLKIKVGVMEGQINFLMSMVPKDD